jgi:PST family polysaccharide transporter
MRNRRISFGKQAPVLKNASYLTLFEILRVVMPFIALPYLLHTVGAENYGRVVYAQAIIACFILIVNFGLDISAVKEVSISRDDRQKLNEIVSSVFILKTLLGILSLVILTTLVCTAPLFHRMARILYFAFLASIADILLPVWYYQGKEKMKQLTVTRFFSITFYTATIFIFIRSESDCEYIPLLQSLGLILSALISCHTVFVRDGIRLYLPPFAVVWRKFRESTPFFMSRASLVINTYMAKIMCGTFLSNSDTAAFDIVQKIYSGAMIPMQMYNQALYPNLAKSQDKVMLHHSMRIAVLLTLGVTGVAFLLSGWATSLLSAGTMPQAAVLMQITCVTLFMASLSIFFGTPTLIVFGHQRPFNMSIVIASAVLLASYAVMILTGSNSIYLYAWTLALSEFIVLTCRFACCRKYGLVKFRDFLPGR